MKKKILVLICIFVFIILYFSLFHLYISNIDDVSIKKDIVSDISTDTVTVDKVISFMEEYDINYLDTFNIFFSNSDILSNQVKLKFVYYAIKENANFSLGVSYTRFDSYLKAVFGEKVLFKNEDILYDNAEKDLFVKYDATNETYMFADESKKEFESLYYSRYNYIVGYKNKDGKYELTVNKFFLKDNNVYSSYGDLTNNINILFEIPTSILDKDSYIKDYVNENYDTLKKKISQYEYIFIKENGSLLLKQLKKIN